MVVVFSHAGVANDLSKSEMRNELLFGCGIAIREGR
jgi:hypothetical protein